MIDKIVIDAWLKEQVSYVASAKHIAGNITVDEKLLYSEGYINGAYEVFRRFKALITSSSSSCEHTCQADKHCYICSVKSELARLEHLLRDKL